MGCSVERTYDVDLINQVCRSREVWETIAEDGFNAEDFAPDVHNECWLRVDCGELVGVYNIHGITGITCQIHPMILPQFRGKIALESGREALKWIVDNTNYYKVVCEIPQIYKNVIFFAAQCGMVREGINRSSYLKHGKIHHMTRMGITRPEIEESTL